MKNDKAELNDASLEAVSGGAGAAAGSYQAGDLVTVKTDSYYYFGVLNRIEVYYDGDTRYVVESAYTYGYTMSNPKVRAISGTLRVNPANPGTGVIIKKIYDYPEPGPHPLSYISKWVD